MARFGKVTIYPQTGCSFVEDEPFNVFYTPSDKLVVNMCMTVFDHATKITAQKRHLLLTVEFVLDYKSEKAKDLPELENVCIRRYSAPCYAFWWEEKAHFSGEEHEALKKHILKNISLEEICEYAKQMLIQQDNAAAAKGED